MKTQKHVPLALLIFEQSWRDKRQRIYELNSPRFHVFAELTYCVKRTLPMLMGAHVPLIVRKIELPRHTTTTIRFSIPRPSDEKKLVTVKWNKSHKFFTVVKRL